MLIGRKIKTKIPTKIVVPVGQDHIEARRKERTCREKQKIKVYWRRRVQESSISVGDRVLIRRKSTFDPDPYKVLRVEGIRITGERRRDRWKKLREKP